MQKANYAFFALPAVSSLNLIKMQVPRMRPTYIFGSYLFYIILFGSYSISLFSQIVKRLNTDKCKKLKISFMSKVFETKSGSYNIDFSNNRKHLVNFLKRPFANTSKRDIMHSAKSQTMCSTNVFCNGKALFIKL